MLVVIKIFLLEDYFLWIRMLKDGFVGYNIQEPILWMRAGKGLYQRRKDGRYEAEFSFAVQEKRFQFMVQIYNNLKKKEMPNHC